MLFRSNRIVARLRIGVRLSLGFGVVVALFLVTVLLATQRHSAVHESLGKVNNQYFPNMVLADIVVNTANANVRTALEILVSPSATPTAAHLKQLAEDRSDRAEALTKLEQAPQTDEGRAAVRELQALNTKANAALDALLASLRSGDRERASAQAEEALMPASDKLVESARDLSESYDSGIGKYTKTSIEATDQAPPTAQLTNIAAAKPDVIMEIGRAHV